ncbi:MAG: MmgE/PrpD family protein [Planktomarina sp.]|nr:MmgE/PrpD family protein [Planktomarina sp.]
MLMQDFAASLSYQDLPEDVLKVLRRSLLDSLGVAAIGSQTEMAKIGTKTAKMLFGATSASAARCLFDGNLASLAGAAMAGAISIDSIDAHDGTSPCKGHAGSAIFPALLALADERPMTGQDFATYLALAYEISYRAGLTQHDTCADYHTSGAWTAVGVAAMTARVIGCNPMQIHEAAGIGEYHGPRSQMMRCIDHPTMVRDGVGWGAPTGLTAGFLALNGFTGAPALTCEGPHWQGLGETWKLVSDTHYKPYPCCRWAHPSIDAAADLMVKHQITHQQISSVEIKTFHNATRLAGHRPSTADEFAYSIAFPVACMIVRGQIGPEELTAETLKDPKILRISTATELIEDPHLTQISEGKRWAQVSLRLRDGRSYDSTPRSPRGDADMPLENAEIAHKFHLFADPILGRHNAKILENLCANFDQLDPPGLQSLLELVLKKPEI